MTEALFNALAAGFSLWKDKESDKYNAKLLKLRKDWYEEYNSDDMDDARLDVIEHRLCLLAKAFSAKTSAKNT